MKLSKSFFKTLREVPNEAEIPSHILLLRAGMIKKTAAGIYSYMPMGWRTVRKIEQIVREEMDAQGAQEIATSVLQPSELWEESGRWAAYGPEMWRVNDRNGRPFCLGPTAEEVFTDIFKKYTTRAKLVRMKTMNMGSLYKLTYDVKLRHGVKEKAFLDEIRVKNCNLKVLLSEPICEEEI